jgi:hypothetical protein
MMHQATAQSWGSTVAKVACSSFEEGKETKFSEPKPSNLM